MNIDSLPPDGAALLRGIIAEPGDDLRRLAFADWLEENGQEERAEFVRLQVRLAGEAEKLRTETPEQLQRMRADHGPNHYGDLYRREAELLDSLPATYGHNLATAAGEPALIWRRGFADTFRASLRQCLRDGARVLLDHPTLVGFNPTDCAPLRVSFPQAFDAGAGVWEDSKAWARATPSVLGRPGGTLTASAFDRLRAGVLVQLVGNVPGRIYTNTDAANAYLAAALLAHARGEPVPV